MASYFRSQNNENRTRYELNLIKFVKSYEYFVGEINKLSNKIRETKSYGENYDNNIISLYSNMKGLVDSVNLYGRRIGVVGKIYSINESPLSTHVNNILCSGNINNFIKKYSEIINSDKIPSVKRRKMLISSNFKSRLAERIEKIELSNRSKAYVERVKVAIGSAVEEAYGVNIFDIPTCGVMQNEERYINVKSPLPIAIEKEFSRLGLPSGKKQTSQTFAETCFVAGQNTSMLETRVLGNTNTNSRPSGRSILSARVYGITASDRTNDR